MMAQSGGKAVENHAVAMDRIYRRQRYVYDFTRRYYLFGRDRLIRELGLEDGERFVEVGCGTARNLIRIARLYPGARLYGIDISSEMLKTARAAIGRAGLTGRIALIQAHAEALVPSGLFGEGLFFDRVLFSYSLSMIPDWNQALAVAAAALSPGGRIHIVDFGDLTGLGSLGAAALKAWLNLFHVSPRTELLHLFESHAKKPDSGVVLEVLPGRYAFLATCHSEQIANTASTHVAA